MENNLISEEKAVELLKIIAKKTVDRTQTENDALRDFEVLTGLHQTKDQITYLANLTKKPLDPNMPTQDVMQNTEEYQEHLTDEKIIQEGQEKQVETWIHFNQIRDPKTVEIKKGESNILKKLSEQAQTEQGRDALREDIVKKIVESQPDNPHIKEHAEIVARQITTKLSYLKSDDFHADKTNYIYAIDHQSEALLSLIKSTDQSVSQAIKETAFYSLASVEAYKKADLEIASRYLNAVGIGDAGGKIFYSSVETDKPVLDASNHKTDKTVHSINLVEDQVKQIQEYYQRASQIKKLAEKEGVELTEGEIKKTVGASQRQDRAFRYLKLYLDKDSEYSKLFPGRERLNDNRSALDLAGNFNPFFVNVTKVGDEMVVKAGVKFFGKEVGKEVIKREIPTVATEFVGTLAAKKASALALKETAKAGMKEALAVAAAKLGVKALFEQIIPIVGQILLALQVLDIISKTLIWIKRNFGKFLLGVGALVASLGAFFAIPAVLGAGVGIGTVGAIGAAGGARFVAGKLIGVGNTFLAYLAIQAVILPIVIAIISMITFTSLTYMIIQNSALLYPPGLVNDPNTSSNPTTLGCFEILDTFPDPERKILDESLNHLISKHNKYVAKVCAAWSKIVFDYYVGAPPGIFGWWDNGTIRLSSQGLANTGNGTYISAHELGHALANGAPMYFLRYLAFYGVTGERPLCSYEPESKDPEEAFPEAIGLFAADSYNSGCTSGPSSFASQYPNHYEFAKNVIFEE